MATNIVDLTTHSKLKDFFVLQLQDIYWAEKKMVKTLPKLEKAATSSTLRQAFGAHLEETQIHVLRLQDVFKLLGEATVAQKCPAMAGIVDESEDIMDETDPGTAQRDVGLIIAAQKAEHYEIATYGGLVSLARTLGYTEAADILEKTLNEEKQADISLTQIAESGINYQASMEMTTGVL